MTYICKNCDSELTETSNVCPNCGEPVARKPTWHERRLYIGGIITGLVIIIGTIFITSTLTSTRAFIVPAAMAAFVGVAILSTSFQFRSPEFGRGLRISPAYFFVVVAVMLLGLFVVCLAE
jgi:hypothetical protein